MFQPILDGVLKYASQATRANAQKHAHVFMGVTCRSAKPWLCQNIKHIPGAFLEEEPTNQSQQELHNPRRLKGARARPFPQGKKKKFVHVAVQGTLLRHKRSHFLITASQLTQYKYASRQHKPTIRTPKRKLSMFTHFIFVLFTNRITKPFPYKC